MCLGKVSVFLAGDPPSVVEEGLTVDGEYVSSAYLTNKYGKYFLNSSDFLDGIDLGPEGEAYTGVGFARVQRGEWLRLHMACSQVRL